MIAIKIEITEYEYWLASQYELDTPLVWEALALTHRENAAKSWLHGYGIYGVRHYEEDGKYYVELELGSTCD